jgi:hypothetical protein
MANFLLASYKQWKIKNLQFMVNDHETRQQCSLHILDVLYVGPTWLDSFLGSIPVFVIFDQNGKKPVLLALWWAMFVVARIQFMAKGHDTF